MTDVLSAYRNQHPALMEVRELSESEPTRFRAALQLNEHRLSLLDHPEDYVPEHPAQRAALCGYGSQRVVLQVQEPGDASNPVSDSYALALHLDDGDGGDEADQLRVAVVLSDLSPSMVHILRAGSGFMVYLNPKVLGHVLNLGLLADELVDHDEWAIVSHMAADLLAAAVKEALAVAHDEALLGLGERFPSVRYGANMLWFDEYDELVDHTMVGTDQDQKLALDEDERLMPLDVQTSSGAPGSPRPATLLGAALGRASALRDSLLHQVSQKAESDTEQEVRESQAGPDTRTQREIVDDLIEQLADLGVRVTMVEEPLFTDHPEDDVLAGGELR